MFLYNYYLKIAKLFFFLFILRKIKAKKKEAIVVKRTMRVQAEIKVNA